MDKNATLSGRCTAELILVYIPQGSFENRREVGLSLLNNYFPLNVYFLRSNVQVATVQVHCTGMGVSLVYTLMESNVV